MGKSNTQENQRKAVADRVKQIADQVAMVRSQLESINADTKKQHEDRKSVYDSPLLTDQSNVRDAPALARVLSENFSTLRFTLTFEGGRQSIHVEPILPVFEVSDGDYYADQKLERARATLDSIVSRKFWPDPTQVQSFALGYEKGSAGKREAEEELRRLRQDYGIGNVMRMGPWARMVGPYG